MSELINKIETFLDRHAMEPSRFGILALNDGHLIEDLISGKRQLRRKTVRKIEDFMRAHKGAKK